jgi:hypothetical protein
VWRWVGGDQRGAINHTFYERHNLSSNRPVVSTEFCYTTLGWAAASAHLGTCIWDARAGEQPEGAVHSQPTTQTASLGCTLMDASSSAWGGAGVGSHADGHNVWHARQLGLSHDSSALDC